MGVPLLVMGGVMGLKIGDTAPNFSLPGVDGKDHGLGEWALKKILVVVFTCNHCPYAQAYEDRLSELAHYYSVQGVQFVAINSNDASSYPEDGFGEMKKRAAKKKFGFPYLRDESQETAKAYGAEVTPDVFLFDKDRVLRYRGRIDDNWRFRDRVREHSLKEAISTVLSGGVIPPEDADKRGLGCSVKWK
jgi:peroxiredoxin